MARKRSAASLRRSGAGFRRQNVVITLAGHSGGGSFLCGFIDSCAEIPSAFEGLIFLDANYSYSDDDKHGDKLVIWLKHQKTHRLVVIAYDDRKVTLNGKPVISSPDGGTFRATERMAASFVKRGVELAQSRSGDICAFSRD